jgi:hypothetical protein
MATPLGRGNIQGCKLVNLTDLGLSLVSPIQGPLTLTSTNIATPGPESTYVLVQLASGDLTVKGSVNSGTPNFGAPTANVTISNTSAIWIELDTTTSNLNYALQLSTTTGVIISKFLVLTLGQFNVAQGWPDASSGQNAFLSLVAGNTTFDGGSGVVPTGSGVISATPTSTY